MAVLHITGHFVVISYYVIRAYLHWVTSLFDLDFR